MRLISSARLTASIVVANCFLTAASADDWSGWMGDQRDGVYRETGIIDEIPAGGLKIKWRKPISSGYAGPAVAAGRLFVFDYEVQSGTPVNDPGNRAVLNGKERLTALNAADGNQIWRHEYDCPYSISYPAGPRCTPTVDGDRVYILGAEGDLKCLRTENGSVVWERSLKNEFGAEVPLWGFTSHPLVDGDLLYTMVGGAGQGIVAFDKLTGSVRWKALDTKAGYCPPSIIRAGGTRQLIAFHPAGISSLSPEDGSQYWQIPFTADFEMSIARPMVEGNLMYVSSIRTEAVMIELDTTRPDAKELWWGEPKDAVHCANSTPLFVKGVVYGTDCNVGKLIAVDAKSGSHLWTTFEATQPTETRSLSHGTAFLTRIGDSDNYFVMSETGDLLIARLTATGFESRGRFHVVDPTAECFGRSVVWSHPAFANRSAYVRNDKEIVAVDLARP